MTRRALFVVNAGSRQGGGDLSAVRKLLRRAGFDLIEPPTGVALELESVIREHRTSADCVILGGGDGTMQQAAGALVESGLPLGILPLGTANDLARTLGLPTDLEQAAQVIGEGGVRRIDISRANGNYFFNVAHIGLGARLRATLSPELKKKWGRLSYVRALVQTFAERRPFRAKIEHDSQLQRVRSIQIAVGNGRYYGGGMTVSQAAGVDDGCLHVYSIAPVGTWTLLRNLVPLIRGVTKDPEAVQMLEARLLTIETERPMSVVADGERITTTPVRFEVLPASVAVYAEKTKEAR